MNFIKRNYPILIAVLAVIFVVFFAKDSAFLSSSSSSENEDQVDEKVISDSKTIKKGLIIPKLGEQGKKIMTPIKTTKSVKQHAVTEYDIIDLPSSSSESAMNDKLVKNGYNNGTGSIKTNLNKFLVGKKGIRTRDSLGKILAPVIIQSSGNRNRIEVQIPAGTIAKNIHNDVFTGTLKSPEEENLNNVSLNNTVFAASFGSEGENINFKNTSNADVNVTIRMPAPGTNAGNVVKIYYSDDNGNTWNFHTNTTVAQINGEPYVEFTTTHFTIFAIGANIWDNYNFINDSFWKANPTSGQIKEAIFGNESDGKTAYTQGRSSNPCSTGTINVINIQNYSVSGLNSLPTTLAANTIYVLNSGIYTTNAQINYNGNCIAVIGKGITEMYSNVPLTTSSTAEAMFKTNNIENVILSDIKINGLGDPVSNEGMQTYRFDGNRASGNNYGIRFYNTKNSSINRVSSYYNRYGAEINIGQNVFITNSLFYSNNSYGIYYYGNTKQNYVINSQIFNNKQDGFLIKNSTGSSLSNVQVYNNYRGITLDNSHSGAISNSMSYNNGLNGLRVQTNSSNNIINNSRFYNNGNTGVYILSGVGNKYYGNIKLFNNGSNANADTLVGITAGSSSDTIVEGLGWDNGSLAEVGLSIGYSYITNPRDNNGTNLIAGSAWSSTNRSYKIRTGVTFVSFSYGTGLIKQSNPVTYGVSSYSLSNYFYDINRYIAQIEFTNTNPDGFGFTNVASATLNTVYNSNTITLTGMDSGTFEYLSLTGRGTIFKNGTNLGTSGTGSNGDQFYIQITSSSTYNTSRSGRLIVGTTSAEFVVTVPEMTIDDIPDNFSFDAITGTEYGQVYTSNIITLTGMDAIAVINMTLSGRGTIFKNGTNLGTSGTGSNGDQFYIQITSSNNYYTTRIGTLFANVTYADFSVTSKPDLIFPIFSGAISGTTYPEPVTITFYDTNLSGATLNGNPYTSGTLIPAEGDYVFEVTDTAGNSTGATFRISIPKTITITFDRNINTGIVTKAPVKYNKDVAYGMVYDDGLNDGYSSAFKYLAGGGLSGFNTPYFVAPGLYYTDGAGNDMAFRGGYARYSVGPSLTDLHVTTPSYIKWTELKETYLNGWDILNHGRTSTPTSDPMPIINYPDNPPGTSELNYAYEILKNYEYVRDRIGISGVYLTHFVLPAGDTSYTQAARDQGYKSVSANGNNFGIDGINIYANVNLYHFGMHRAYFTSQSHSEANITNDIDTLMTSSNGAGTKLWRQAFTHGVVFSGSTDSINGGLEFTLWKYLMDHISNNYGKNGSDKIWFAGPQEVYEYVATKQATNFATIVSGNQLIINLDTLSIPSDLRRKSLSLLVTGTNANIASIAYQNGAFTYHSENKTNGLINLELGEYYLTDRNPDAFDLGTNSNADIGQLYSSNAITLTGMSTGLDNIIYLSGAGTLYKNGSSVASSSTGKNGDQFYVRLTSSNTEGTTVSTTLKIGPQSQTYSITPSYIIDLPNSSSGSIMDGKLIASGYNNGTGSIRTNLTGFLVGNRRIRPRDSAGKILAPVIMQSLDRNNIIEAQIPAGTVVKNSHNGLYTGILNIPESKPINHISSLDNAIYAASFGFSGESINFENTGSAPVEVTIRMPAPGTNVGDFVKIHYSDDNGSTWNLHTITNVIDIEGLSYVEFATTHFTDFVIQGGGQSYFLINSGDAKTTSTGVTLNMNVPIAISGMRFSNDNSTRSNRQAYATTKSWFLTTGYGMKTVYAEIDINGDQRPDVSISDDIEYISASTGLPTVGAGYISFGTTGYNDVNGEYYYKGKVKIAATVYDADGLDPTTCEYTIDGTNWNPAVYNITYCDADVDVGQDISIQFRIKDIYDDLGIGNKGGYLYDNTGPLDAVTELPTSGDTINTTTVNLQRSTSVDTGVSTSGYIYEVSTLASFDTIFESGVVSTTGITINGLTSNTYYWRVTAFDKLGNTGDQSNVPNFIVQLDAVPPTIGTGEIYVGTTGFNTPNYYYKGIVDVKADVSDANGLDTDSCMRSKGSSRTSASYAGTSTTGYCYITGYDPQSDIEIRFRIKDSAGNLSTGGRGTYIYDIIGSLAPVTQSPTSGTTLNTGTVTIQRSTSIDTGTSVGTGIGTSGYNYEVSTNSSFTAIVSSGSISSTSKTLNGLGSNTYYWRVNAFDKFGNTGDWSNLPSFIVQLTQVVSCRLLPTNAHYYSGLNTYSITQNWNSGLPGWAPSNQAYYDDNDPDQYTCEYACNNNFTRVGAMDVNLGQITLGSLTFSSKMDSQGNLWISYIGEGSKMQVKKTSSTGVLLGNRTGISDYTLESYASLGIWLDSSDKPYVYYGTSNSATKTIKEFTGNTRAQITTLPGDKPRIMTDNQNNLYLLSAVAGTRQIRNNATLAWSTGTFPSSNSDGGRVLDKNGRVVFGGTNYMYRYENGAWTKYTLSRSYDQGAASAIDNIGGTYRLGNSSSKLLVTYLSDSGTLTNWYFNGTNGLSNIASTYSHQAGTVDSGGNFRATTTENNFGVIKYNGSSRQYRSGLTTHGTIDYVPLIWQSKQGGIRALNESVSPDKIYGAYYSGGTWETDIEVSSESITGSMMKIVNPEGDTMIGYINLLGEYVLTNPEEGCSAAQVVAACQNIADPNGVFINGTTGYNINQTWDGTGRVPNTGSYYDDGTLIANTCEYKCKNDSIYSGAIGLCVYTLPTVGIGYISVGTTGINNSNGNLYYKGNVTVAATVFDASGLSGATCEYTIDGINRDQANYSDGLCTGSASGGPDLSIQFRIKDIYDNLGTGGIGSYIYDATAPIDITLVSPASGTNININTADLLRDTSIDEGIGMSGYFYQVATDISFSNVIFSGDTTDTGTTLTNLTSDTYYRRVYSYDIFNNTGNRSSIRNFNIVINPSAPTVGTGYIAVGITGLNSSNGYKYYKGNVTVAATVYDADGLSGTTCEYTIDGTNRDQASYSDSLCTGSVIGGLDLYIRFRIKDIYNNLGTGGRGSYRYDILPPAVLGNGGSWLRATNGGGTSKDYGYGVATDSLGNSYVVGSFRGTGVFGSTTLENGGLAAGFIGKLSPVGEYIRATKMGGGPTYTNARAQGVTVDNLGNSYVIGSFQGTGIFGSTTLISSGTNIFIAKLSPTGEYLRAIKGGGSSETSSYGISVDNQGNSYIAGGFYGTGTFGSLDPLISSGGRDIFVAKIAPNGEYLRAVKGGGAHLYDSSRGITVDSQGNSYIAGYFAGTGTFGSIILSSSGSDGSFVAKINPEGEYLRVTLGGASNSRDLGGITVDSQGNTYVAGIFVSTANFGSITLTGLLNTIFVAKLSPTGEYIWAGKGAENSKNTLAGITLDDQGNIYIAGSYGGQGIFGSTTLNIPSSYDLYVAKLSPAGEYIWAVQGFNNYYQPINGISVDGSGNSYVVGSFQGTENFGSITVPNNGGNDPFIAKLSQSPGTGLFTINNNNIATDSANVTLNINCPVDAGVGGEVIIYDNNTNMNGGTRTGCEITKPRVLAGPDGVNTVYMKTKDALGNISEQYSDDIMLDGGAPIVDQAYISSGTTGTNGTDIFYKGVVDIRGNVSDTIGLNTGTCEYTINNGSSWIPTSYSGTTTAGYCYMTGLNPLVDINIKFRVKDNANNLTTGGLGAYTYDATAPTIPNFLINSGALYTNTTGVTLKLGSLCPSDVGGIGLDMVGYSNTTGSRTWTGCSSSKTIPRNITSGDGLKTVNMLSKDKLGNISSRSGRTITLNATTGSANFIINGGAISTTSSDVTLSMSTNPTAIQMRFSNTGEDGPRSNRETYSVSKFPWALSAGYEPKTVFAQFDVGGGDIIAANDSINYIETSGSGGCVDGGPGTACLSLEIIATTGECRYGQNLDLGNHAQQYATFNMTGAFTGNNLAYPLRWSCNDTAGRATLWNMQISSSDLIATGAGGNQYIISSDNIEMKTDIAKVYQGDPSVFTGVIGAFFDRGTNLTIPRIVFQKTSQGGTVGELGTDSVDLRVIVPSNQEIGQYQATITIVLPQM